MTIYAPDDALGEAILAAWDAVPETYLSDLFESMPARSPAVINADGKRTEY